MVQEIVYLDVVFLINLLMDYVVLWAVGRFGQFKTTLIRLVAGALLGATYSLAVFLPDPGLLLTIAGKVLFSAGMVLVSYSWQSLRRSLQAMVYFYMVAFAMGGAVLGAVYVLGGVAESTTGGLFVLTGSVRATWLIAALVSAWIVGRWGSIFIKRNLMSKLFKIPVIICFGENRFSTNALVDTGNQLKDPVSQQPVMIAEYGLIKVLFPPTVQKLFENADEPDLDDIIRALAGTAWATRIRIIPFTTIGKRRGMLLGLRPDMVIIVTEAKPVTVIDVVVGVYQKRLSPEGTYRALLSPDLVQSAIGF
ncbi:MAG: sigma-E processing peptidase SpoIIGA [Bacillota bacterium]